MMPVLPSRPQAIVDAEYPRFSAAGMMLITETGIERMHNVDRGMRRIP